MSKTMKKLVVMLAVGVMAMVIGQSRLMAHNGSIGVSTTAVVDVMVTPIITVDLTANPTYYNFGLLDVNTSSYSATVVNLQNTGNVGVSMQKHANDSGIWTVELSSGLNKFRLYVATATGRPNGIDDFVSNDMMNDATTPNTLYGIGGSDPVSLIPQENVGLWFRIDMPTATSTGGQRTIPVHFQGTAQ